VKSEKLQRYESLVSSFERGHLSNFLPQVLNNCLQITRALLPQACHLCGADSAARPLCAACLKELPWLQENRCAVCAVTLATGRVCGACLEQPPRFEKVEAVFAYRYPVDALIRAYKYRGRLALARVLAELLAREVARDIDVIVPTPLAPRRLAERGFNQALEIARVVAAETGIALIPDACRKTTDTPPQASLPWKERSRNVRRTFVCDADFDGERVAVVDDVLTTGATLNELARVLRKAGAGSVRGWVIARALPR
jgi:ComF family protein